MPTPNANRPDPGDRRRALYRRVLLLVALYSLPLAGLAVYFLTTGIVEKIAFAERERLGLAYLRPVQHLLAAAITQSTQPAATLPPGQRLDDAFAAFAAADTRHAARLGLPPNQTARFRELAAAAEADASRANDFLHELRDYVTAIGDQSNLILDPELDSYYLADITVTSLPALQIRLRLIQEAVLPSLRASAWSADLRLQAALLARLLEENDLDRIERSSTVALADNARRHPLPSLQQKFPRALDSFLGTQRRLVGALREINSADRPTFDLQTFALLLTSAESGTREFWMATADQLDAVLLARIAELAAQRRTALLASLGALVLLTPLAWLIMRNLVGPTIQGFIDDALAQQQLAATAQAEAAGHSRRLAQMHAALADHCAVIITSPQGKILAVNPRLCLMSGYAEAEIVGRTPRHFSSGLHPREYFEGLWSTLKAGKVWRGVIRNQRKDGSHYWIDATMSPFRDSAGNPSEFISIQTDISELVHAREAAEAAAQAKSQFLAMMSHEIRTPMNGVIGFATLLADTRLDEQQREYVRTIVTSGDSLLTIINDILDFSKLEAAKAELESRPVVIRHVIEDVLDLLTAAARAKGLEISYWMAPGVPEGVLGDETRLRQILLNLAGNALKFTARGSVEISVLPADTPAPAAATLSPFPLERPAPAGTRQLTFHVRDTGVGIPPDKIDRLFKAFSQVDSSVTRTHGGTGLGLAICQRLVGLMGGEIGVKSDPGSGSDFHFTLPCHETDVAGEVHQRTILTGTEISAALHGRRVLLVDDVEANRRLYERILAPHQAGVVHACDGAEALAVLERQGFDLALIDYMMPQMDGVALAQAIRRLPRTQTLPLVLVSSMVMPTASIPTGLFAAVVTKPLRNLQFASLLARVLNGDLAAPKAAVPALVAPTHARFAETHPARILVVEDNAVNLRLITVMLKSLGYEAATAGDGAAALALLASAPFDLVLMDVQMPVIDGFEATRRLRRGEAGELNRDTRIVALTANAANEDRDACFVAGMNDFLSKPIQRPQLLDRLAKLM